MAAVFLRYMILAERLLLVEDSQSRGLAMASWSESLFTTAGSTDRCNTSLTLMENHKSV